MSKVGNRVVELCLSDLDVGISYKSIAVGCTSIVGNASLYIYIYVCICICVCISIGISKCLCVCYV